MTRSSFWVAGGTVRAKFAASLWGVKYPALVSNDEIPIFPLGNVVLFPTCDVPLHIFEPRYRQMTAAALEGERVLGMIAVRPDAAEPMAGEPALYSVGCAGFIEQHQLLADGRYQILLRATERFRIEREIPLTEERSYRLARVEALSETVGDTEAAEALRGLVIEQLEAIAHGALGATSPQGFDGVRLAEMELAAFVNGVANAVTLPPQEKQGLLEADTLEERVRQLESALGFYLAARSQGAPDSSETIH